MAGCGFFDNDKDENDSTKTSGTDPSGNPNTGGNPVTGGGGSEGTLTITDIPSEYNGKSVMLGVGAGIASGYQSFNMDGSTGSYTLCLISNGSVSVPMWIITKGVRVRYSGNDSSYITGYIFNDNTASTIGNGSTSASLSGSIGSFYFFSVTFSNGSATESWNNVYQQK